MQKITYLCLVFLLCFSFKGLSQSEEIKIVRLDFVGPMNYTRHLALGFTPNDAASDNIDYGYDSLIFDQLPDEMNWMIEGKRFIIQGVGQFNTSKYYPLGMFLSNSGEIKIVLKELENFETPIDVYIYDTILNTFTSINDSNYIKSLSKGEYLDRFYITFTDNSDVIDVARSGNALSVSENELKESSFNYIKSTKELVIKTNSSLKLKEVSFYDVLGKKLLNVRNLNTDTVKIPLSNIKTSSSLIVSLLTEDGKQFNKHIIIGQ